MQADFTSKTAELTKANELINQLKADDKSEELTGKITKYETDIQNLQTALLNEKKSNALKLALSNAKAKDIDYITFKVQEKGDYDLDENGKIKGWDETLKNLKAEFPNQFETVQKKKIDEKKLNTDHEGLKVTKEEFSKWGYAKRAELYEKDRETYDKLTAE